jgi:hypothetical protein
VQWPKFLPVQHHVREYVTSMFCWILISLPSHPCGCAHSGACQFANHLSSTPLRPVYRVGGSQLDFRNQLPAVAVRSGGTRRHSACLLFKRIVAPVNHDMTKKRRARRCSSPHSSVRHSQSVGRNDAQSLSRPKSLCCLTRWSTENAHRNLHHLGVVLSR